MADELKIAIDNPLSAVANVIGELYGKTLDYSIKYRDTMSISMRDGDDRIRQQIYWDWRYLCQKVIALPDPIKWPEQASTGGK